jgi:hypothetical protein
MRTFTALSGLTLLCLPLTAHADFVPVLPGSIQRVVATGDHIAVLRDSTVFILHEDGSVLGRIAQPGDEEKPAGMRSAKQEAEHILDLLDVAESDRGTDYADDLLDNERGLAQRRRAHPGAALPPALPAPPPDLAASATDIWIAAQRGIFHVGADGIPVRESGRDGWGAPLAAAGQTLLAAKGANLALLATPDGPRRLVQLSSPPRKVALSASGQRQAWATPDGIDWTQGTEAVPHDVPASAVSDLSYCGETLVVLLADSMLVIPPTGPAETRARGIQAHRLLCPQNPAMPWLALGPKLLASVDQGRQWVVLATPAGAELVDVAASSHHLWIATRDGLFASANGPAPRSKTISKITSTMASRRVHAGRGSPSWLSWMPMPKVSVRAAATFAPGSHQLEALAFAAFPLNGGTVPIVTAAFPEDTVSEPEMVSPQARRSERAVDLHDPDESCLATARRKAVALAMSEPERARSYVTRAGHAAWLPELRVLVSRRYGRSESLDVNSSSTALTSPLGIDTVNDIRYEARATWDLGRLVFSSEELAAQTQAMHMAELRRDIETTMNRLYFERRGLLLDTSGGRADSVRRPLRAREIEADLDALSAGAFAACVSRQATGE